MSGDRETLELLRCLIAVAQRYVRHEFYEAECFDSELKEMLADLERYLDAIDHTAA